MTRRRRSGTRSGAEVLTLKGHTGYVNSASFSPDGSRIVTGSWDNTARVWDAKSGAEVLTLKGHTSGVMSASFSPDGSRIVTASKDQTAKVWDARPLQEGKSVLMDAQRAYDQKQYATAARLWAEGWPATRDSTRIAGMFTAGNRPVPRPWRPPGKARRGQPRRRGEGDAPPAGSRRTEAELMDRTKQVESAPSQARLAMVKALAKWRGRRPRRRPRRGGPGQLPANEQKEWRALGRGCQLPDLTTAVFTSTDTDQKNYLRW